MLARQDGRRPNLWHDYLRVREACHAAEQRYGLRATAPADRTAAGRPSRAEHEKACRRRWHSPRHPQTARQHGGRRSRNRTGLLRPPPARRGAGAHPAQHPQPWPDHRLRRRPASRHDPHRRPGLVQRRQACPRPYPAQAPPPLEQRRASPGNRGPAAHLGRTRHHLRPRRPRCRHRHRADPLPQLHRPRRRSRPAWRRPTPCTRRRPCSAAHRSARPPTPTTAPPTPPTARSRARPRQAAACAAPHGCCPPTAWPQATARHRRSDWLSGWPPSLKASPTCARSSSAPPRQPPQEPQPNGCVR